MTLKSGKLPPLDELDREALIETTRQLLVEAQSLSTRITVLNEIATAINETLDLKELLKVVKKKAKWLLDFDYASVVVREGGSWKLEHLNGKELTFMAAPFGEEHPVGKTLKKGRPYRGTPDDIEGWTFRSFLSVPIKLGSEVIGSLNFGCHRTDYDQDDVRIGYMLSQQLAAAIRNTQQFEALNRVNEALNDEKHRSDDLLHNILPAPIASELKSNGSVSPVHHESASVLFTDFKGFTEITRQSDPAALVEKLNWCFSRFDAICEKHGVEKLKTIGDAFMCVSGVPDATDDHALRSVRVAQDILKVMDEPGAPDWDIRIGIHSGALISGVIGTKKFNFDVWGDTVNVAARVESHGRENVINLTKSTYDLISDEIDCEPSDQVTVKGMGTIQLYQVRAEKADPPAEKPSEKDPSSTTTPSESDP